MKNKKRFGDEAEKILIVASALINTLKEYDCPTETALNAMMNIISKLYFDSNSSYEQFYEDMKEALIDHRQRWDESKCH